jgi:hypothetical protein
MPVAADVKVPGAKRRSPFRRGVLILLGLIAAYFGGVFAWDWLQARSDAQALDEYFAELYQREPEWQSRVYGRPPTAEQEETRRRFHALANHKLFFANPSWMAYRTGLYQGMFQDPNRPGAVLPQEQVEYLHWAMKHWKPLCDQFYVIDEFKQLNRLVSQNADPDEMLQSYSGDYQAWFRTNEILEVQAMGYIATGQPKEAVTSLRRILRLTLIRNEMTQWPLQYCSLPSFIERLLNLTDPADQDLEALHRDLSLAIPFLETKCYLILGAECRLTQHKAAFIAEGKLSGARLELEHRRGSILANRIDKDSHWNEFWLRWAKPYYLSHLVRSPYRRRDHVILRLHQLADRIESLASLPVESRWATWKAFADANNLPESSALMKNAVPPHTDAVPDGVFYLFPLVHTYVRVLHEQEAQMKTALAAIAAERFRIAHGRLPRDWSELVPKFLDQPILDPFTGKPLIIKSNDQGIVIYSVGREGRDEGGEKLGHNHYWRHGGRRWDVQLTNLGTRLLRPELRRQAPIELEESHLEALRAWKEYEQKKKQE